MKRFCRISQRISPKSRASMATTSLMSLLASLRSARTSPSSWNASMRNAKWSDKMFKFCTPRFNRSAPRRACYFLCQVFNPERSSTRLPMASQQSSSLTEPQRGIRGGPARQPRRLLGPTFRSTSAGGSMGLSTVSCQSRKASTLAQHWASNQLNPNRPIEADLRKRALPACLAAHGQR